jgi:hypothetical protein
VSRHHPDLVICSGGVGDLRGITFGVMSAIEPLFESGQTTIGPLPS